MASDKKTKKSKPLPPFNLFTDIKSGQRYFLFNEGKPCTVERFEYSWLNWYERTILPQTNR